MSDLTSLISSLTLLKEAVKLFLLFLSIYKSLEK